MTRRAEIVWKPGDPHPVNSNLRTLAAIIRHELFPTTHRGLEKWPLVITVVNGQRITNTEEGLRIARAKLARAHTYKQAADRRERPHAASP